VETNGILLPAPTDTVVSEKQSDGTLLLMIDEVTYSVNTNVQLKAIPASGYYFVRWKGTLTDESQAEKNTITIPMTCAKQITAVFAPFLYKLKINIKPIEGGKLTISPAISAEGYVAGTKVTITASANSDYKFTEWTGDFSSNDTTAIVTMDGNKIVTVNFTQEKTTSSPWLKKIGIGIGITAAVGLVLFLLVRLIISKRMPPKGV
jgi:hypothetical protein